MGYYCNQEIAEVCNLSEIALANNPNFVVFSSRKIDEEERHAVTRLRVVSVGKQQTPLTIEITETQAKITHKFTSTYDSKKVNDKTFLVVGHDAHLTDDPVNPSSFLDGIPLVLTAQNLKDCLMKNSWLRNNFEITMDISKTEGGILEKRVYEDNSITIKSKGCGPQYDFQVTIAYDDVKSVEADYSISLADLDYSTLNMSNFELTLEAHFLRAAIRSILSGDVEKNDGNNFKVVFPDAGRTVQQARLETLKNLRDCLLREEIVYTNLQVYLNEQEMRIDCAYIDHNPMYVLDNITSSKIVIQKGNAIDFIKITSTEISTTNSTDTIDYGSGKYQIELDVYTDHGVFPGDADTEVKLGKYVTTLSKSYFGRALWFDLSSLLSKKVSYSPAFLTELELDPEHEHFKLWSDAGTMTDYRFIAKRTDGAFHIPFYYSSPLYVLNGYNYTLDPLNIEKDEAGDSYILDFSQNFYTDSFTKVKPLTTNFIRTHIKGQRQYFNYIYKYKVPALEVEGVDNLLPSIGLHYKLYTQSGVPIATHTENGQQSNLFKKVNTALLHLDQFLPMYNGKIVGRIDVYLCRWHKSEYLGVDEPEVIVSTPLTFRILPEVLNEVNDFAFLNQLGGWDTINFGGTSSSEFKTTSSTIYKTLQPDFNLQSEIESVALKSTQEQKVVQTSPVTTETLQWMRQLSTSPAVYELSTKRYILIDDMSLKYNSTDDLYQVEMKYHYTDTLK